jgi:hypothetical protein
MSAAAAAALRRSSRGTGSNSRATRLTCARGMITREGGAVSSSMQTKRSNIPRSQRELELVPRHLAPHAPRGVGTRAHLSLCLVVTFRLRSDCGLRCGSGRRLGLGVRSSGTHQHALCGGQRRDDLPPVARGRYPYIPGARVRGSLVITPVARGSGCGGRRGRGGADGRAWFGLWSGVGLGG